METAMGKIFLHQKAYKALIGEMLLMRQSKAFGKPAVSQDENSLHGSCSNKAD
jgi:hypothetical protein